MGCLAMQRVITSLVFMAALMGTARLGFSADQVKSPGSKWTVTVVNDLPAPRSLFLHCQSKDDDVGEHTLVAKGQKYQWSFKENLWGTTLFWCSFKTSTNQHATFEVFWPESQDWLAHRCNWEECVWVARDAGMYLLNIPDNTAELIHQWER